MAQWSITSSSSVRFRRQKARKPVCSGCVCLNLVYGCMSYIFFTSRHLYEVYMVQQGAAIRMGSAPLSCPSCTTRFSPSSGFPGGSDGKESACSAGDRGSIPRSGRSPGKGNGNPLQYSYLGTEEPGGSQRVTKSRTWLRLMLNQSSGLRASIYQIFEESLLPSSLLPKETLFLFICLLFMRVSGTAERLHKPVGSGWKNKSKAVHCHIKSSGMEIRTAWLCSLQQN